MKRRHLVALVSVVTLLTTIFVGVVTVGVGVGTDTGRDQIRALLQHQLAGSVRGKVHLGRIGGGFLTSITIDTFAIRDENDSLLVSTGRITANYDPRDLVDRRILLREVQVEHPVVRFRQYENGEWNYRRVFSRRSSTPDAPGRSFGDFVVLDSVRVRDGQFVLIRPWSPADSLRGVKRDSAIQHALSSGEEEIRRSAEGFTHTYRWTQLHAFLPHVRLADPDSNEFGQVFAFESLRVEETDPPFSFRNVRGVARRLGDSVFVEMPHFELPQSRGSATGKIWWGSDLPTRLDIRVRGDTVALNDVAWVYPTLPREGGGRTLLRIRNDTNNLRLFEYALSDMDVRSTRSRLTGAMTFVVGGPVLAVRDVDLRGAPVNFDLLRTLAGGPFPVDWQGDLFGYARGPGGPLTNFVVDDSRVTFRDAHVRDAVSRGRGSGELNILEPELTEFRGFKVAAESIDLRSIQYLFPNFPRVGGTLAGTATLDSSWLDVRFSSANVTHRLGPGDPSRLTGSGRVTWGEQFMTYDATLNARPVSLTMLSRSYPLGLEGLMSGPIRVRGIADSLELNLDLSGPAGRITYDGTVDAFPLSVAARGSGRVEGLDVSRLVTATQMPPGWFTGLYELDVRGDTNDLATLHGVAALQLDRSELDGIRIFPSRMRARFADGRMYIDTLRVESVAAVITASGALGLKGRTDDSVHYQVIVDSLGGLRQYVNRLTSTWRSHADDTFRAGPGSAAGVVVSAGAAAAISGAATGSLPAPPPADSMAGTIVLNGVASGSLTSMDVSGRLTGTNLFVRREAGREISGAFGLADVFGEPSGTLSLQFNTVNVGRVALDTLGAVVRFDAGRSGAFAIGALSTNGVTLSARGDLSLADHRTGVVVRDVTLSTDSSTWKLRGPATFERIEGSGRSRLSVDSLVLENGNGGRVSLEAYVPPADSGHARVMFRADSIPLRDIGAIAQIESPMSGWGRLSAQGAGTAALPVMNMQATVHDVRYGDMRLERVDATAHHAGHRTTIALNLARGGRTALVARGSLPLDLRYFDARITDDSLRGSVRTDSTSFDIVEALVPGLRSATGRLVANVDIAGTWIHPDVAGEVRVEDGEVTVDQLGVRMRGVNVDLAFFGHSDSLAVRRFAAWSGQSPADSVSLRGYVAYRDLDDPYLNLRLTARNFRALDRRSLARLDVSTETDGVRLRGRLRGATLTGGMVVERGTIYLPDPDVARKQVVNVSAQLDTSADARRLLPAPPSRLLESILIDDVSVTLGEDVWLRSREANIKLVGSLNVQRSSRMRRGTIMGIGTLTGDDSLSLALDGELRAERGTYTLALGLVQREFQVESGTITFFGTSELAPELNISALHTVRTADKQDLRIRVRLTGPLYPNPIVSLESAESFNLSQSALVSYLIFGQPDFELGSQSKSYVQLAAQTLFPSAQAVAAAQLRDVLGSWADIVQWQPGFLDPSAVDGTSNARGDAFTDIFWTSRLGAEKQITQNLFVSLSTGICPFKNSEDSSNEFLDFYNGLSGRVELRLSTDASIRAGKEPSAQQCGRTATRLVQTPSQWGLSLFKTWRF